MKVYKVIDVHGNRGKLEDELNWLYSLGADIVSVMYTPDDLYQVVYSHDEYASIEDRIVRED